MIHINVAINKESSVHDRYLKFFKISLLFALLLMFLLLQTSCNGNKINEAELQQVDSVLTLLANSENILAEIDFNSVSENNKKATEQMGLIKGLIDDSIMLNKNELSSNLKNMMQSANDGSGSDYSELQRKKFIEQELSLCKKQIEDLKSDYKNGKMDKVTFNGFYENEKNKALKIANFIKKEHQIITRNNQLYDSLNPLVVQFIDSVSKLNTSKNK